LRMRHHVASFMRLECGIVHFPPAAGGHGVEVHCDVGGGKCVFLRNQAFPGHLVLAATAHFPSPLLTGIEESA
jgi:hypothetical protein